MQLNILLLFMFYILDASNIRGAHPQAQDVRRILARWKVRVDDSDNGVFLHRDARFIPHTSLSVAFNHASLLCKCCFTFDSDDIRARLSSGTRNFCKEVVRRKLLGIEMKVYKVTVDLDFSLIYPEDEVF